jgi:DNA mismatch endonuclease (patch repair protein)
MKAAGGVRTIRSSKFEIRDSKTRNFKIRPDFVFLKSRTALFVGGCFWHGCPKHGTQPRGSRTFRKKKFIRNKARDRQVTRTLRSRGWRVLRVWEHTLRWATRKPQNEARLVQRVQRALK